MDSPQLVVDNTSVWQSLRRAIAESSGFQRWCRENEDELLFDRSAPETPSPDLDRRISLYLKDTLQTLAY
jgi:hypothetical protein